MVDIVLQPRGFIVGMGISFMLCAVCYLVAMTNGPTFEARKTWAQCAAALTLFAIAAFILAEVLK